MWISRIFGKSAKIFLRNIGFIIQSAKINLHENFVDVFFTFGSKCKNYTDSKISQREVIKISSPAKINSFKM